MVWLSAANAKQQKVTANKMAARKKDRLLGIW